MSPRRDVAVALLGLIAAASIAVGCGWGGADGSSATDTPTTTGSPTPTTTTTTSPTATPTGTPDTVAAELRDLVLASLTAAATSAQMERALEHLEVHTLQLNLPDRDAWFVVSSGFGVYELPSPDHVAAVYERRDGNWVETARLVLESAPTMATAELAPVQGDYGYPAWIAVHGATGAHSGTFELLRFDGSALTTSLWWFSPSPAAAEFVDLDGDGVGEIVLNGSDPYVFCYACGVVDYAEVIYRWEHTEPVAVTLVEVSGNDEAATLNAIALRAVEADRWQVALDAIEAAREADPGHRDIAWNARLIGRIAAERLAQSGSPQQPLVTAVLAGDYAEAFLLMRAHVPAQVFALDGPLVAGTVAVGWEDTMGTYLVDYATRAIALEPDLAEAYLVRALGRIYADPDDAWGEALTDADRALALQPSDAFTQAVVAYLLDRNGGSRG